MSVPYVIEKGKDNQERVYDLYSRMLKDRIIFIRGPFDAEMADAVVAQLLFLESVDNSADIFMYINSPGGEVTAMYAIYDVMNYIKPDVVTVGFGVCASAGSFILAAGTKGKRHALPNCEIMLHELSGGSGGKFNDIKIGYEHTVKLYERMIGDYSKFTGQDLQKIKKDLERDFYMSAEESKTYGLIDAVHTNRS